MYHSSSPRPVLQLDRVTHQVVARHESTMAAARAVGSKTSSAIIACCLGQKRTSKNFAWQYDDGSIPVVIPVLSQEDTALTLDGNHMCFEYFRKVLARTPKSFSGRFTEELLKAMEEYADSLAFTDELMREKEAMLLRTL